MKPLRPNHAAHVRHEVQSFVVLDHEEELTLAGFWEKLDYSPEEFKHYDLSEHGRPKEGFGDYMNEISESILKSFPDLDHDRFHNTSTISPLDDPTGTPDFVVYPKTKKGTIHWTEIDATVDIHSAGGGPNGFLHTFPISSASRPCFCPRFLRRREGCRAHHQQCRGVKKSPNLNDAEQSQLIYAFVKRLYDPHPSMIDPTVKRRKDMTRIEKAPGSVGRRTHIFVNNFNPTLLNGVVITVVKDQYCYRGHRFNEAEVLRHVHVEVEISAVVHLAHSEVGYGVMALSSVLVCSGGRQKSV